MERFIYALTSMNVGDRIVVPKSSFDIVQHHAIYLGVHGGHHWLIENKEGVGVQCVTAQQFFNGVLKITEIRAFTSRLGYSRQDLLRIALSKIGTPYHLVNYNCETFCNEVQYGQRHSRQVNAALGVTLLILTVAAFASAISSNE